MESPNEEEEERPVKRERLEPEPPSHLDLVLLENVINAIKALNNKAAKERNNAHFLSTLDNERSVQHFEDAQSKLRHMHDVLTRYLEISKK